MMPLWLGGKGRPNCSNEVRGRGENGSPGRCCAKNALGFLA